MQTENTIGGLADMTHLLFLADRGFGYIYSMRPTRAVMCPTNILEVPIAAQVAEPFLLFLRSLSKYRSIFRKPALVEAGRGIQACLACSHSGLSRRIVRLSGLELLLLID